MRLKSVQKWMVKTLSVALVVAFFGWNSFATDSTCVDTTETYCVDLVSGGLLKNKESKQLIKLKKADVKEKNNNNQLCGAGYGLPTLNELLSNRPSLKETYCSLEGTERAYIWAVAQSNGKNSLVYVHWIEESCDRSRPNRTPDDTFEAYIVCKKIDGPLTIGESN